MNWQSKVFCPMTKILYIRNLFIIVLFGLISQSPLHAQARTDIGVKGGLNLTFFKVDQGDFGTNPDVEAGYYGGLFATIQLDEAFSLQPELLYIGIRDYRFINAPIYARYEVAQKVSLLAGPSLNYFFDFFNNKFKVRADISAAYEITTAFDIHLKYTIGFEEFTPSGLFIGGGLRL